MNFRIDADKIFISDDAKFALFEALEYIYADPNKAY